MSDLKAILDRHGPLALAVVVLAWLLYTGQRDAAKERASHTAIVVDQLSDLREKAHDMADACRRSP